MTRRAKLFEKMALTQKLHVSKKRRALSLVKNELAKNQAIKIQLKELLEAEQSVDPNRSGMSLYSASWFNTRVRDQIREISGKCEHLTKEVFALKKDIAVAEHKRNRQTEKAAELFYGKKVTSENVKQNLKVILERF